MPTSKPKPTSKSKTKPAPVQRAALARVDRGRIRSGLEIPRKLLHTSFGPVVIAVWCSHPDVPKTIQYASVALLIVGGADCLRFTFPSFERLYERVLGYFMREDERDQVNGVNYYLLGILIVLTFFPRDIACLSVLVLSICDTSASVFGRLLKGPRLPLAGTIFGARKSLAGTTGAVVMGCLASYIFWVYFATQGDEGDLSWIPARVGSTWTGKSSVAPTFLPRLENPNSTVELWKLVLLSGGLAGLAEAIEVMGLDDNLTLPVLFAFFLWVAMTLIK